MKKIVGVASKKTNDIYLSVTNRLRKCVATKKAGSAEDIVGKLLLLAIGVGLCYLFKDSITELVKTVFKEISSEITTALIKEPTA